jgi:hypothetical protein
MKVTFEWLQGRHVCPRGLKFFKLAFPDGVDAKELLDMVLTMPLKDHHFFFFCGKTHCLLYERKRGTYGNRTDPNIIDNCYILLIGRAIINRCDIMD